MPQPYSYQIDIANPFQSAVQGLQLGRSLEEMQAEREQRAMQAAVLRQKMAEAEQAAEYQRQMNQDLGALAEKGGNATGADYAAIITKYPQLSEHFKRGWDILAPEQQQARVGNASRVLSALYSGNKQIAVDDLMEQADAARNSGKAEEAKAAEAIARVTLQNPLAAQQMLEMTLVTALGPDKFMENFGRYKKLPAEVVEAEGKAGIAQAEAGAAPERQAVEIKNIESEIKAREDQAELGRLQLAQQRREAEMKPSALEKLTDAQRKEINLASEGSSDAQNAADELDALAQRFTGLGTSYGALSKGSEALKKLGGSEDYATELKKQYIRLRNSEAVKMLPKGPASDRDVAMAMEGFMPENANPATVASFLRGMAKLRRYESASLYAKAQWHSNVGHLGKAPDDFVLDGVLVPKGTTYIDFARGYLKSKKAEIEGLPAEQPAAPAPKKRKPSTVPGASQQLTPEEIAAMGQYGVKL